MGHLLLHAAGNTCNRRLRLMHLHDSALLSTRMSVGDWIALGECDDGGAPWWALPPLAMVDRYYPGAIPADVLAGLSRRCPLLLRLFSRSQTMTGASCSGLWLHPLSGVEWSRSAGDVGRYLRQRERRVGKECVRTCRSRGSPYHVKNTKRESTVIITV